MLGEDGSVFLPGFKLLMFPQGAGIMPFPRCSAAKFFNATTSIPQPNFKLGLGFR